MTNTKFTETLEPIYDFMEHILIPDNTVALNQIVSEKVIPPHMFITLIDNSELSLIKKIIFFLQVAEYLNKKHNLNLEFLCFSSIQFYNMFHKNRHQPQLYLTIL